MNILDYIRGNRKGREANRLEREAMSDPLLADALEGFETVEGNHEEIISRLRDRIAVRSQTRRKRNVRTWTAVAAVALLLLTVGGVYWGVQRLPDEIPQLADVLEPELPMTPADSSTRVAQATDQRQQSEVLEETSAPELERQPINIVSEEAKIETSMSFADFEQEMDMAFILPPAAQEVQQDELAEMVVAQSSAYREASRADSTPVMQKSSTGEIQQDSAPVQEQLSGIMAYETSTQARRSASGVAADMEAPAPMPVESTENLLAWKNYLERNQMRQFDEAGEPIRGNVIVEFRVNRQGRPQNARVLESLAPGADREALRLLQTGPDWDRTSERVRIAIEFK